MKRNRDLLNGHENDENSSDSVVVLSPPKCPVHDDLQNDKDEEDSSDSLIETLDDDTDDDIIDDDDDDYDDDDDASPLMNQIILTYSYGDRDQAVLHGRDLKLLNIGKYFNDELIRFGLYYNLINVIPEDVRHSILLFDPTFNPITSYPTMNELTKNRFHDRFKLDNKKFLVFPVHYPGSIDDEPHWYLAIVIGIEDFYAPKPKKKQSIFPTIIYLNSKRTFAISHYIDFAKGIRAYLHDVYFRRYQLETRIYFSTRCPSLPQQPNNDDCGLFVVEYLAAYFTSHELREKIKTNQRLLETDCFQAKNITRLKYRRLVMELIENKEQRTELCELLNWHL